MKLRFITPDVVKVPEIGRVWRVAGGVAMMLFGAGYLALMIVAGAPEGMWMGGIVAVFSLVGGASIAGSVKQVIVDRANGLIIKRRGKFTARHKRRLAINPKAVRLTMDRESMDDGGIRDMSINKLFIVHDKGETLVTSCRFSLGKIRALAEALAQFLDVEQYEDRLFRFIGAFDYQSGLGKEPTRTYIDRNMTIPVPPEDRDDPFLDCEVLRDGQEDKEWVEYEKETTAS